jgi:stage II sporulation protein M
MKIKNWVLQYRPLKHYVIAATLVFLLGAVLGYTDPGSFRTLINSQIDQMKALSENIKQSDPSHVQWSFFYHIFLNNMFASIMAVLLGAFFGIFPLLLLVTNGLLLGYVASDPTDGHTLFYFLKGILPHGIIEIPAFILACTLGLRFGFLMIEGVGGLFSQVRDNSFKIKFRVYSKQLLSLMIVVTGLMLLAAIIESTITYSLMK